MRYHELTEKYHTIVDNQHFGGTKVYKNPNRKELELILSDDPIQRARAFLIDGNELLVWSAYAMIHFEMARKLGLIYSGEDLSVIGLKLTLNDVQLAVSSSEDFANMVRDFGIGHISQYVHNNRLIKRLYGFIGDDLEVANR